MVNDEPRARACYHRFETYSLTVKLITVECVMPNGSGVYRAECSRVYGGAVRSRRLEMAGHCIKHPLPGDPRLLCSLIEIRRNDRLSAAQ